jgi:hypothetical protein
MKQSFKDKRVPKPELRHEDETRRFSQKPKNAAPRKQDGVC